MEVRMKEESKKGSGKGSHILSGKMLFKYDPSLFKDDEGAADVDDYEARNDLGEVEENKEEEDKDKDDSDDDDEEEEKEGGVDGNGQSDGKPKEVIKKQAKEKGPVQGVDT